MFPPIPVLSHYGISPTYGFLPEVLPLTRLPDPYYNKWEAIAANLQALILSRRLRGVIDRLPVLSTIGLEHDAEWRRAYSLLAFMAHGYIWGGDSPSERLPPAIAVPLLQPLFVDEGIDSLENLATLNTFTGSLDESWFYLVSVAIEARGGPIITLMLTAIAAAREGDTTTVTRCLRAFAERLDDLGTLLQRMHENCDPTIFYHRIRPFLAGSKNMAEAGLPNGVLYEVDDSGRGEYRQYSGGSNAQSSIIQFFDIVLGIEHRPTGEKPDASASASESESNRGRPPAPRHNFIQEMRKYMPGPHARFLNDVASTANIREFVESAGPRDKELRVAYDACLSMLRALRDKHIAIVTRYIVTPSREVRARSRSRSPEVVRQRVNLATASRQSQPAKTASRGPQGIALDTSPPEKDGKKDLKGTGGTQLMAFLKQARDETGEPAIEDWARQFMNRKPRKEGRNDFFLGKEELPVEQVEIAGLAGTWTMEEDFGGICSY
ncbi:Indoleamine 2,3-dioxygenase [Cytospora mali]|uniref:Indoleamine 2,3-dioxygenase n=1 Tax=Cytospora mali TaxID=578113 RepID=A0A194UY85_CYTMA|nr:Indoleamine 2,3-dioxygenase [Valsa mali var. pyri (nom. inval.)]